MRKIAFVLFFVTVSICCFSQTQNREFQIIGTLSGFEDSSFIKLWDFTTGQNVFMDSAQIINGRFAFKGTISSDKNYQSVGIMTSDYKNRKIFWLESGIIYFIADKGKFGDAVITGSSMQDEANLLSALVLKNPKNEKMVTIDYIKNHPNSFISGHVLKIYCKSWGKNISNSLYNELSEMVKQSEFGKSIYDYLTLTKDIKIGDKFVDFTLPDISGKNVSLSDYKNKYVLLDFWGSWCSPCREENPNLVKTYNEFKDKAFDILGVSAETSKKSWVDAIRDDGIIWKTVSDLKGVNNKAALIYGIYYYPANFLIDPNGIIIAKDLRGNALKNKLAELLK